MFGVNECCMISNLSIEKSCLLFFSNSVSYIFIVSTHKNFIHSAQFFSLEMACNTKPTKTNLDVVKLKLDTNRAATELLRYGTCCKYTAKRVKYTITHICACLDNALQKCLWFLAGVLFIFRHTIANARDIPDISRSFRLFIRCWHFFTVVNKFSDSACSRFNFNFCSVKSITFWILDAEKDWLVQRAEVCASHNVKAARRLELLDTYFQPLKTPLRVVLFGWPGIFESPKLFADIIGGVGKYEIN